MKSILNGFIKIAVRLLKRFSFGAYILDNVLTSAIETVRDVQYKGVLYKFAAPNRLSEFRAESFSSKEPETLEWVDSLIKDSVLWDIGANVGLYSIYAAKTKNCRVFAFEPSVFNLELLARNIFYNQLTERVTIIPIPLNDKLGNSILRMSSTEWGGALSSFDHDLGYNGEKVEKVFEFNVIGVSMENTKDLLNIPQPDYIKMDVDGIEHFILKGGMAILQKVKGLIIEVNDDFSDQSEQCRLLLTKAGLKLKAKRHSDFFEDSSSLYKNCYNQIWDR